MDVLEETTDVEQVEAEQPDENVKLVPVMAPYQFGAMKPVQVPAGKDCPVVILVGQGGWTMQAQFAQNDAIEFARRIKQAVKDARSGLAVARTSLLGANGEAISSPTPIDDDDDLDEAVSE